MQSVTNVDWRVDWSVECLPGGQALRVCVRIHDISLIAQPPKTSDI